VLLGTLQFPIGPPPFQPLFSQLFDGGYWTSVLRVLVTEVNNLVHRIRWALEIRSWELQGRPAQLPSLWGAAPVRPCSHYRHDYTVYVQRISDHHPFLSIADLSLVGEAKCKPIAAFRFSSFRENPLVSRVKRLSCIRMVKFCRSTKLVEMCLGSGTPLRTLDITSVILGGSTAHSRAAHSLQTTWSVARSRHCQRRLRHYRKPLMRTILLVNSATANLEEPIQAAEHCD